MSDRLSEKQMLFVSEYLVSLNATDAARKAGYKSPNIASAKLMKNKVILNLIEQKRDKSVRKVIAKKQLNLEEVLQQIHYAVTRTVADLVDMETGKLLPLNKMGKRARECVNGIKQKVKTYQLSADGPIVEEVETEVTLVPKQVVYDMAMKHFGAYAAEKRDDTVRHVFDFDSFTRPPDEEDRVEKAIENASTKRIIDSTAEKK